MTLPKPTYSLITFEVGNTEILHDDKKERTDKTALTIQLKDMLDAFLYRKQFKKKELEDIYTVGVQVSSKCTSVTLITPIK